MNRFPIEDSDKVLISRALDTLRLNYDGNYHTVAAAILCKNGNIYTGINCDGIHGSCAEFIAIGSAITAGEREFEAITAVHLKSKNNLVPPCGNCRQMLFEYCPDIKVILNDSSGEMIKTSLRDLLPLAYEEIK